ncbi:carbohydrate-binding protein [Streptacidiphilus sp. N1-12]|uniref:Carbohydrate-binding protein n=2 Tax=Streptacidiphilus alkalitolerans TaxID=3342712 RepID=A0ABV6W7V6_9ACTN
MRTRLALALVALLALLAAAAGMQSASAFTSVPTGAPARPAPPATPDPSLTDHQLTYAEGPLDNPDKGLAVYYNAGTDQNTGYPHSITWSYFPLSAVMTNAGDCTALDWTPVEKMLNETASYGNTAAIRFYLDYPSGNPTNGMPACWNGKVPTNNDTYWGTQSPDYNNAFLLSSLQQFIGQFGAKYDGDPRIGFIQMGLIGYWGEWHTWPENGTGGQPDFMATDANAALIVNAFANAFHTTKIEVRYPTSGGGAANNLDVGYHDDSFCYREGTPLAGVTLPQSMGGADYSQLQYALNEGVENKWITDSMGGEVRPEIQGTAFNTWSTGANGSDDDMKACIEAEHTTWKLDQGSTSYSPTDPDVGAAVRAMGYDLTVPDAYYKNTVSGTASIGVKISNDGVAPFYHPWTVRLGLKDSTGKVVKTWNTSWDLRQVMPLKIRAFPDWNVGADPTYLPFGYPQYFNTSVDTSSVTAGSYQLVMDVVNPLSAVSSSAKSLRFANAAQNADGWLGLGAINVGAGGGDTTAPSAPTGLAVSGTTAGSASLTWTASTDNVGVTGYDVYRGSTKVGSTAGTGYTDTGLSASTAYSYTVDAYDAAGNTSARSGPVTATTQAGGGSSSSYEAEASANTLTGTAVVAACTGCSGGQKVGYLGNGATVAFHNVAGGSGGATQVTVAYTTAVARTFQISANGGTPVSVSVTPTADWQTTATTTVTLPLNAGSANTVTIANPTDWAPDIDRITVGVGAGGSTAGSFEAEASANTLTGTAVVAACGGCSGGQKVGYLGNGATVTFRSVAGGSGGAKQVTVAYTTAVARSFQISANGGTPVTVSVGPTADWQTTATTTVTLSLNAGSANTVTIANPTGWAPDIDRITV